MIYLLEDDESIRKLVIYTLESQGLPARGFAHPDEFWQAMGEEIPSIVLLDIMLPGEDGLSILAKLRSRSATRRLPVIMLTARNTEYDRVEGLDKGADDFICKPFGMMELVARIRAVLRRSGSEQKETLYRVGSLSVSPEKHEVRVAGEEILLTYKEFELLCLLLEQRGKVLTRDKIMDLVWDSDFERESRTVDVHIRTLRAKLGPAGGCIETVRGLGYKIGDGL